MQCSVCSVQCAVYSVQCAVYSVQCAVCPPLSEDSVSEGPLSLQADCHDRVDRTGDQDVLGDTIEPLLTTGGNGLTDFQTRRGVPVVTEPLSDNSTLCQLPYLLFSNF